ncbi:hypothetical protein D6D01_02616 [Aureobasidium pullulans]|uniref:Uncharacterized protein n=1 Tax=Aureobasidium pullulans TaxID=5580 RepID=A0A4S9LR58_AURPU|nr:hypothetical protein D6D01_02616 [Aureobasidium pullulans]
MGVNYALLEVGEVVDLSNIQSEVNSLTPTLLAVPSDNNILGLRAQILDNFAVTMPTELKPKIVMAHDDNAWWVIIYGNDDKPIWKTNKGTDTAELALRKMLQSSSDLVFEKFKSNGFALGG